MNTSKKIDFEIFMNLYLQMLLIISTNTCIKVVPGI